MGDVDKILESQVLPFVTQKSVNSRPSKIESAGEIVMQHLLNLAISTDLSCSAMAKRINENYNTNITKQNVVDFFSKNAKAFLEMAENQKNLSSIRAKMFLEPNTVLVKDIKTLDDEIQKLLEENMIEPDKRAKVIGDLIDKKGRLLLRQARISGTLKDGHGTNIDKMQVNVFNESPADAKSDLINRLKKAEFKEPSESNIKPMRNVTNETKKIDNKGLLNPNK